MTAEQDWDLEQLYSDLSAAKQAFSGRKRPLTPMEKACLQGLLCGQNPTAIAAALNREPRGLRVDLCRGLYRYAEVLTKRSPNALKDWRDIADWLEKAGYRTGRKPRFSQTEDSEIKIVDLEIADEKDSFLLDIKVRNIGHQVAFLKQAKFQFQQMWLLQGWLLPIERDISAGMARLAPSAKELVKKRSRMVKPSYAYQIDLGNILARSPSDPQLFPVNRTLNLSQCVDGNDADRFTIALKFSLPSDDRISNLFASFLYHLDVNFVYNENNQIATSQNLFILVEPDCLPDSRQYLLEKQELPDNKNFQLVRKSRDFEIKVARDRQNRKTLLEIKKKASAVNPLLAQLLQQLNSQ